MPIFRASGGYRFGTHGKLYKGKGARRKALTQGRAIKASQARQAKVTAKASTRSKGYMREL
jgi:hypothetical protein